MNFLSALTIVFIVLKIIGVITWPWLLVFAPLIIQVCLGILIFAFTVIWKLHGK